MDDEQAQAVGRRVRRRRRAAGLSQDQLAARADVSRQAVGALEAGRHLPRVDAAVRLARALSTTVEDLLAIGPPRAEHVLGASVADGTPVRAARVTDRTVVVPVPSSGDGEMFAVPDGVVRAGRVEVLPDGDLDGFVVLGCDPALGILDGLAPARGPGRLVTVLTSSATARVALTTGRAHAAIVHDTAPPAPRDADRVRRLTLAAWRTGIAAPSGREESIVEALAGRGRLVGREPGAAAQAAYMRALEDAGIARPSPGPVARGHLDAARRALETGLPAVTIEPVAAFLGLVFQPLETHRVEVWIADDAADHPGADVLGELLASTRLRRRLDVLPGYDLTGAA